jgi:hypothetical protein
MIVKQKKGLEIPLRSLASYQYLVGMKSIPKDGSQASSKPPGKN